MSAFTISFTYASTYYGASFPYFSIILTIALPTMAPSDWDAIFFACSGVEILNPTATGISVTSRTKSTIAPISVVFDADLVSKVNIADEQFGAIEREKCSWKRNGSL